MAGQEQKCRKENRGGERLNKNRKKEAAEVRESGDRERAKRVWGEFLGQQKKKGKRRGENG